MSNTDMNTDTNTDMNTDKNTNTNDTDDDTVFNYTYKDVNLAYSHEPIAKPVVRGSQGGMVEEMKSGGDDKDSKDMRSNRAVRNAEIPEKEIINKNSSQNPIVLSAMMWISNSVSLLIFSIVVRFQRMALCLPFRPLLTYTHLTII